jgi:hypothetical protein
MAPSVQSPPLAAARFALRRSLSASPRLLRLAPAYRLTRTVRDDPRAALTPNPSRSVPESVSADTSARRRAALTKDPYQDREADNAWQAGRAELTVLSPGSWLRYR